MLIRNRSHSFFARAATAILLLLASSLFAQSQPPQPVYLHQDSARFRVYYVKNDAGVVPGFWQTLHSRVPDVEGRLGLALADTVSFVIAADEREWFRMTAGAPLWANGLAYPDRGLAIVKSPRFGLPYGPLPVTAVHEYVHMLLSAGAPDAEYPRWLDEGLAQVLAGQLSYMDDALLARAAAANRLHSFSQLEMLMTMSAPEARQGYAESAVAVQLLQQRFGWPGISNLIHELRAGRPFEEAFNTVFGENVPVFESQYEAYVRQTYKMVLFGDTELWVSSAFIVLILAAGVAVWIRRRRTLKRWQEEGHPEANPPSGDVPYTINYEIVRNRMQDEGGESKPDDSDPPHDKPLPGN